MRKSLFVVGAALAAASVEAGEIRGRLLIDDKPASGVTVAAVPYESALEEARRDARRQPAPKPLATGTSAPDGSFALVVPPEASGQGFRLSMMGGGAAPTQAGGVYDAGESTDIGDQTLPRAAKLAGRVVDQKNQPVPGAEVRLTVGSGPIGPFANATEASSVARTTLTGADGMFRFDDARQQNNRIAIEARGYANAEATGLREGAVPRSITLGPGYSLSGVVRGPDRKPAAGALLRFEGKADSRWIETGPDGSFRLADLPAGNGALIVDGGDRGLAEVRGLTLPDSASQKLQIVLAPGAAIEGRVVDAKTGSPLPMVKVIVRSGERVTVTRSAADGRYRVANLLPQRYRVEADDARYVLYERVGIVVLSGATEKVDLPLTAGATLSGRVVDEDGAPVAGARGRLQRGGEGSLAGFLRGMRGDRGGFRSGPDGVFKATRLAPGENQSLTVSHQRYESRTLGGLTLPPGGTKAGVTVVLSRGLALAGVVKDAEGNPVSGVELQLMQARNFRGGRGGMNLQLNFVTGPDTWPRATSGSDGRFQFQGLSKGDYTLTARKPGLSDAILDPAKVTDGAEPIELLMNAGASISGVVLDTNGNPAEGYFVQVRAKAGADSPMRGGGPRNATGPDGFFFADGLKAGDAYDLMVMGPDGPGPRQEGVTAPADGIALSVPSRGRISGRVVDAGSGQAVTDFEIALSPDRTSRGGMVIRMAGPGGRRGRGQGEREQIHADDGSFVLDEVAQGNWEVDVTAKSYQNGRVGGITLEAGQSKDGVLVKLSRGSAIRGRVIDARSGRGIPDARVNAEVVGGQMRPPMLAMLQGSGGLATDADGMFEIDGLSQGRYTVTAEHPDFSDASQLVEVKEGLAAIEIRLAGGSSLGGVVLSDTRRPLAGANVALEPSGEGGFGRRVMLGDAQAAVTDDQGRFRFDHLTAGRYRVIAAVRDRSSSPVDTVVQASESRDDLQLLLQAGATIRGQVTGLLDTERTNVNVTATGPESYFAASRTSSDGRFELSGAPAGTLTLRASAGDFLSGTMRSASTNVVVPEGQPEASAEIVFENGFSISGSVTRGGKPVTDATVMANQRGAGSSSSSRTDSAGAYHLEGLRAGTYNVMSFSNQGSGRPQEVKLDGDATVDIVIPVARIAGTVVEATSKQPLSDASVDVSATSGGSGGGPGGMLRLGGSTDSNGRFSFEDLEPKDYTLTARRAGFQFERKTIAASESGTSDDVVIELQRGEGIGIVAKDGIFGIPLRGLMARVTDAGNAPVFSGPVSLDSEGRGEIPSVRPGSYAVILDASGYAPVTLNVSVPSASLNVLMTPGGSIEFRAGEVTRAQGTVNLTITDAVGRRAVLSLFGAPGSVVFTGANHLVENVPPGRYTVTPRGGAAQSFTVAEGGRTVVDLP